MCSGQDGVRRVADLIESAEPDAGRIMLPVERGGVPLIEVAVPGPFGLLLTTRLGGASGRGYADLNLSYWVGDDSKVVDRNHTILARSLDLPPDSVVLPRQVHGVEVLELDECRRRGERVPCDGLVVRARRDRGLAALMLSGDCLTVVLVGQETCALVHAGWRGLVNGIVQRGVEAMGEDLPQWAFFGPAIGPCCYQVGEDTADTVATLFGTEVLATPEGRAEAVSLDLWKCATVALGKAGVPRTAVVNPALCTSCHRDVLYSHRADGPTTGRHTAVLWVSG